MESAIIFPGLGPGEYDWSQLPSPPRPWTVDETICALTDAPCLLEDVRFTELLPEIGMVPSLPSARFTMTAARLAHRLFLRLLELRRSPPQRLMLTPSKLALLGVVACVCVVPRDVRSHF